MKKILFFLVISLGFSVFTVIAQQQTGKYVVWFTNGSSIECLSFENTEDGNLQVLRLDGKTAIYSIEVVDRITIAGRTTGSGTAAQKPTTAAQQGNSVYRPPQGQSVNATARPGSAASVYSQQYEWVRVVPWKNPFTAGLASAVIPGLGQFYNGQVGLGFAFMGSWLAMGTGAYIFFSDGELWPVGAVFAAGAAASWVWSILHASDTAKKINAHRGYVDLRPVVLDGPNLAGNRYNYSYGFGFCLVF